MNIRGFDALALGNHEFDLGAGINQIILVTISSRSNSNHNCARCSASLFSTPMLAATPSSVAVLGNPIAVTDERNDRAGEHQPDQVAFFRPTGRWVDTVAMSRYRTC